MNIENFISPQWLTQAFQTSGLLKTGKVVSYTTKPLTIAAFQQASTSILYPEYQGNDSSAPASIVLKLAKGQKEYLFFTQLALKTAMQQIVACHYAKLLENGTSSIFLLEDLTPTHEQTQWPIPPSVAQCYSTVACLANFHAIWWNHADLQSELLEKSRQDTHWLQRIYLALDRIPAFIDFLDDRLSKDRRNKFEKIAASGNKAWLPEHPQHGSTVLHGDAHFWNFLFDRGEDPDKVKVFDWNSWNIGRATDDLAYMIGLHWYAQRKLELEEKLLQHYYQKLMAHDISYTWDDLLADYRLSTIASLLIPVWQWQQGISAAVWWSHLERGFLAFDQWDCMELL